MNTIYDTQQRGSFTNTSGNSQGSVVLRRIIQAARVAALVAVVSLVTPPFAAEAGAPNGEYKYKNGKGVLISPLGRIPLTGASLAGLFNVNSAKLTVKRNRVIVPIGTVKNLAQGLGTTVKITGAKAVKLKGSGKLWRGKAKTKVVARVPASLGFGSGRVVAKIKTRVKVLGKNMTIKPKIDGKYVTGGSPLAFTVKANIKMKK